MDEIVHVTLRDARAISRKIVNFHTLEAVKCENKLINETNGLQAAPSLALGAFSERIECLWTKPSLNRRFNRTKQRVANAVSSSRQRLARAFYRHELARHFRRYIFAPLA